MFVLFYFFAYPFIGVGACGWVVDAAGHGGWLHPAGAESLANRRVVLST